MYLRSMDRNGNIEVTITESELNALSNAICEYCHTNPKDARIYALHKNLYGLYEVVHHGANFDSDTIRILSKLQSVIDEKNAEEIN